MEEKIQVQEPKGRKDFGNFEAKNPGKGRRQKEERMGEHEMRLE